MFQCPEEVSLCLSRDRQFEDTADITHNADEPAAESIQSGWKPHQYQSQYQRG